MKSLKNKRVLITRPEQQAKSFIDLLKKEEAHPIILPTIELASSKNKEEKSHVLNSMDQYDWIIFTSTNAVRFFLDAIHHTPLPEDLSIAAIGKKTKIALEENGIEVNFMPKQYTAVELAKTMPLNKGEKVCYPRSEKASTQQLHNIFKERNTVLVPIIFYQNNSLIHSREKIKTVFEQNIDYITFTSGSTAKGLRENLDNAGISISNEKVVCIGNKTASAAEKAGFQVNLIANPHTIEGMVKIMKE